MVWRRIRFVSFLREIATWKMQTAMSRIWPWVIVFIFYNYNHYTTIASLSLSLYIYIYIYIIYIYIYIYVCVCVCVCVCLKKKKQKTREKWKYRIKSSPRMQSSIKIFLALTFPPLSARPVEYAGNSSAERYNTPPTQRCHPLFNCSNK